MSASSTPQAAASFPLREADRCVKCGLCLPHCPTYRQTGHEGDSPRGRIALMQGLATGLVPASPGMAAHLDGCLSCRACESACPAHVPYGHLIDAGRALLRQQRKPSPLQALLRGALTRRWPRRLLALPLWLYQRSGLQFLLRKGRLLGRGRLARLESLLPRIDLPLPLPLRAKDNNRAKVALFTGCVGELADRTTLSDTLRVLARLGIAATVPQTQGCCGALHQHGGDVAGAQQLARQNQATLQQAETILSCASGCGATLLEYAELTGSEGAAFSSRVQDVAAYLLANGAGALPLKPLKARVALHTPCTQKHAMRQARATRQLLEKIPDLEIVSLDPQDRCCGAAGSYLLTQPAMADALLAHKLDAARRLAPDYIVGGNVGCAMHLQAGLRRAGLKVPVLHPVNLLAQQLD